MSSPMEEDDIFFVINMHIQFNIFVIKSNPVKKISHCVSLLNASRT